MKFLMKYQDRKLFLCTFLFFSLVGTFLCSAVVHATVAAPSSNVPDANQDAVNIVIKSPAITYMGATSKGIMKIKWKKVPKAERYVIYRSTKQKGSYVKVAVTKKNHYTDKKGKKGQIYYYRIAAEAFDEQSGLWLEGRKGKAKKGTVRKNAKRIAYVGDSITTGFQGYHIVGKNTKVFAKKGINASTFYGTDLMEQLVSYKPDRMILMFGMNGLVGSPSEASMQMQVDYIKKIIKACRKKNSKMEIIIMGVSPVSATAGVRLGSIKEFNKKLKKSMQKYSYVRYYSLTPILASSNGYLKHCYNGGDGIHWNKTAYDKVYHSINEYVKEWEQ